MATSPAPGPHSLSLKVLRLSRPSLATQTPLPSTSFGQGLDIPPSASLAHPSAEPPSTFPLTPLLTLPAAFGAAYVGETFACTLCANCESSRDERVSVGGVRITADLQTPSEPGGVALDLTAGEDADEVGDMDPGSTVQRTLRHALKEEGAHVLAVTVSYTETHRAGAGEGGGASGGRARSFRKLYQFTAQSVLAVRSKVTPVKVAEEEGKGRGKWVLEAQVENVGEASVVLESVGLKGREGIEGRRVGGDEGMGTVLKPLDVEQVMFVLEGEARGEEVRRLAQLEVGWRGAMGERGGLTTGWLGSRM